MRVTPRYHKRVSILERYGVNMVRDVYIDGMHALDLGIGMFIANEFEKVSVPGMDAWKLPELEKVMVDARAYQPKEFNRKFQPFSRHVHWKANEHRNFLLFILPVLSVHLKVKDETLPFYRMFIMLFVGLRILSYEPFATNAVWIDDAERMLSDFFKSFVKHYGPHRVTMKIHQILHIADQVRTSGRPLYAPSAYPFESYMSSIKNALHSGNLPLSQLHRRFVEIYNSQRIVGNVRSKIVELAYKVGDVNELKHVISKGTFIATVLKDSIFAIGSKEKIVRIVKILRGVDSKIQLITQRLMHLENLFTTGLNSSEIGVFRTDMVCARETETYELTHVLHKLFAIPIPFEGGFALIPMTHVNSTSKDM